MMHPTLVSIPAWCDWERGNGKPTRYFPSVSIPAWCDWERGSGGWKVNFCAGFNSSLVRLGVYREISDNGKNIVSIPAWCDWEVPSVPLGVSEGGSFNSSLVRLGALQLVVEGGYLHEFQFQLGAIGRTYALQQALNGFRVSIPAWCDWESRCPSFRHATSMFQFQLGAIGS